VEREGNIVRYSRQEIDERLASGLHQSNWAKVDAMTEEELERLIEEGGDEIGFPKEPCWSRIMLGAPWPKRELTVSLDGDMIEWFQSGGDGYQDKINAVLRSYFEQQKRKERGLDPSLPAYNVGLED